jgi:uncharacterized membrane protein YeaQ/YmgE (transglycosylase-associated protein family)
MHTWEVQNTAELPPRRAGEEKRILIIFVLNHKLITTMNILLTLLFGAIAGWLAGFFVIKDKGGLIWNIIIGLLGGVVGGWLLGLIGAGGSFWSQWYGQIVSALIGAVVLLWVWNQVKKLFKK